MRRAGLVLSLLLSLGLIIFLMLGRWMDVTKEPVASDIIVCLGGGDWHRIEKAIALYEKGYAKKGILLLTGDDVTPKRKREGYQDFRLRLLKQKYPFVNYLHFPDIASTREEASFLIGYMQEHGYQSALVVTDPPHSGRFLLLSDIVQNINGSALDFHMVSSGVSWWNKAYYWENTFARRYTLIQFLKIPYNLLQICCSREKSDAQ